MTDEIVICANNVSKEYRLGLINHGTLYRDIQSWWARFRGRQDPNTQIHLEIKGAHSRKEIYRALDNVSFNIKRGDVIGIIGRNGAGKSTLLKIISRITTPTSGEIRFKGKISSLLEVGTGFHPELTGRENIFLNGTILGMSRKEIENNLEKIIEFSELKEFIDTPVKRYSSGMYVRLAFSVAAHLDSDILILDEVLAVGDAVFQKKCLQKIGSIAESNRTILIVSHNLGVVSQLCNQAIWIEAGRVKSFGQAQDVVRQYLSDSVSEEDFVKFPREIERRAQILEIGFKDDCENPSNNIHVASSFKICIKYAINEELRRYRVGVKIALYDGLDIMASSSSDIDGLLWTSPPGEYEAFVEIPGALLTEGKYLVTVFLGQPGTATIDRKENIIAFRIIGSNKYSGDKDVGIISRNLNWTSTDL